MDPVISLISVLDPERKKKLKWLLICEIPQCVVKGTAQDPPKSREFLILMGIFLRRFILVIILQYIRDMGLGLIPTVHETVTMFLRCTCCKLCEWGLGWFHLDL